ncbi:NUDIX domain-containing protein [Streptomyces sp. NPDC127100]|uniref:NUDIX domain-containing protein n=1 Tax=Streptomyces sp. NPDC127100 TaxID=3347138 RepID=UPI00364C93E6
MTATVQETADVVCVRGDEVLLIRRGWPPYKGKLALPGGYVDDGETPRAAAARELLEETGVRVTETDLVEVGVFDRPGRDPRGNYVSTAYLVNVPEETTAQAGDDAEAVRWVPLATTDDLAFDHDQILHEARQKLTR